jgi:CRP-like cAMP-binding protein
MHVSSHDRFAVLSRCPVFATLPPERVQLLAEMMRVEQFAAGDDICVEGEHADELYVVVSGRMTVHVLGRSEPMREMGPSEIFGELAMFSAHVRTSTVRAKEDSVLLSLDYTRFRELLLAFPEASFALLSVTVARLLFAQKQS